MILNYIYQTINQNITDLTKSSSMYYFECLVYNHNKNM